MTDLVTFFPNWRGDPYVNSLLAALAEQGWRVEAVGRRGLLPTLLSAIGGRGTVHIHWFEGFNPERRWGAGLVAWLYLPLLWLAGRRGRLVWTVHNVTPHEGYPPWVGKTFVRFLARSCSLVLVHFESTRQTLVDAFGLSEKVRVIPPAAYGHAHGPPIDRSLARASISDRLTDATLLFVQFGSLLSYKQPDTTIRAFRDAAPPSAMLLVAGPTEDEALRAAVVEAAEGDPRVLLRLGRQSDADLVAALCAADWSICPYVRIDNPGAVNLSVSYGCPVIAPAFPSVRELTMGHAAILYRTDGPARQRLEEAIAMAGTAGAAVPEGRPAGGGISRSEQARRTAEQYLAARGAAARQR
jgi:beta-1,4-mannosyltransferase